MEMEVTIALIAGGVTIFTSLLIVGITIFFKTKNFEDEYGEKVEKIKIILKSKMDRFVLDMIKDKLKNFQSEGMSDWKEIDNPVFRQMLTMTDVEIVNPRELDELIYTASEYDLWSEFIIDCKKLLRQLGVLIIIIGAFVLGVFAGSIVFDIDNVFLFAFFIGSLIMLYFIGRCSLYHQKLKKIDETFRKIEIGIDPF